MQVAATLPATGVHFFPTRRASFKCNGYSSPLKPITRASSINAQSLKTIAPVTTTTEMTKIHLSNLEKLLQKEAKPEPVIQKLGKTVENRGKQGKKTEENRGRNLLEGLNLSRIWPEMKAAEEMSPRHLIRLHRMLSSKSMEYSPRNNLGSRWKEYHGCKDWLGLLDPLDENLRRELVRYGEFIQAAYHCFHSDPATSANDNAHVARDVSLPDRSYKVTKSLYATSSIGLPKWVDDVAPDLGWMTQRSSWIGYVAVCDDKAEIQRMGRRDIVIALRGTATCLEWGENLRDVLVQMPGENELVDTQPKVECGFLSLYKTGGAKIPSLAESVVNEVKRLVEMYKGESLSITVTGHSLGAALALLVADDISTCSPNAPPVAVFSFGGPRVGNKGFVNRLESKNVKVLRIVNKQDVITKVPGMFVSEAIDKKLRDTGASGVLNLLDNSMPWAYSHVGTELRVDTTKSPFLKPDADVACCHDLEAYLHLVDGYLGSNESFRPNAKRSLAKLLNEQGANIKKLYKGKDLSNLNLNREFIFSRPSCLPSPSVLPSPSS